MRIKNALYVSLFLYTAIQAIAVPNICITIYYEHIKINNTVIYQIHKKVLQKKHPCHLLFSDRSESTININTFI